MITEISSFFKNNVRHKKVSCHQSVLVKKVSQEVKKMKFQ